MLLQLYHDIHHITLPPTVDFDEGMSSLEDVQQTALEGYLIQLQPESHYCVIL